MKANRKSIHIVVENTLGQFACQSVFGHSFSALEKFLSVARHDNSQTSNIHQLVYQLFGYQTQDPVPVAAFRVIASTQLKGLSIPKANQASYWACADPLHLEPDRDQLIPLDPRLIKLETTHAEEFVAALNDHFKDRQLEFRYLESNQWVMRQKDQPDAIMPINNDPGLRSGSIRLNQSAHPWVPIINEIQMLLFSNEINQRRELTGELTINSLALWGAGNLPDKIESHLSQVLGSDLFTMGLACHNQISCSQFNVDKLPDFENMQGSFLYVENFSPVDKITERTKFIDQVIAKSISALANNKFDRLFLYTTDKVISANRWSFKKFWRRIKPLQYWCQAYEPY